MAMLMGSAMLFAALCNLAQNNRLSQVLAWQRMGRTSRVRVRS